MSSWDKELNWDLRGWTLMAGLGALVVLAWVVFWGARVRGEPARCAHGFISMEARCCADGQGLSAGQCVGLPQKCALPFVLIKGSSPGCVYPNEKVKISGGSVVLGPTDWDSVDVVKRHRVVVRSFAIDKTEVSYHDYEQCVQKGSCTSLTQGSEPGLPVTGISPQRAQEFCAHLGGRLPTPAEWIFAASGKEARRYPWGAHGLACRRSSYGIISGPCANHAITPDLVGSRPLGRTPEGLLDMSGNVAEWARDVRGVLSVHGGSFRSKNASELKTWSQQSPDVGDDVGFRCAYLAED